MPVEVGGVDLDLSFEVVSAAEIQSLEVAHGRAGEYSIDENKSVPLGSAIALARDEAGEPIFGGEATWALLDDAEREELDVHYGDRLDFEYKEGERVPFRVTLGRHSEVVYLPMNPNSDVIFGADAFAPGGCDAKGQLTEQAPLLLVILALLALRRRAQS